MQNRHGRRGASFNPLVDRTVESEPLPVTISIDIPPLISLVDGATRTASPALSSSTADISSITSSSSETLVKGAANSSPTSIGNAGNSGHGSGYSIASSSSKDVVTSTIGTNRHPKHGYQPAGGGKHFRLTCITSPGGFDYYPNMPAATGNNFPGATAFTTDTSAASDETTKVHSFTTRPTGSGVATGTTDGGPSASITSGVGSPEMDHSSLSLEAIIGIVVALGFVVIGVVLLVYRRRRAFQKNNLSPTQAQNAALGRSTTLATTTRSRQLNSSNEESGILSHPPLTERKGPMRSSKRPPAIIVHPSSSSSHGQENYHSNPSVSPARSQSALADVDPIAIDGRPPTPLSPLIIITPARPLSHNYQ